MPGSPFFVQGGAVSQGQVSIQRVFEALNADELLAWSYYGPAGCLDAISAKDASAANDSYTLLTCDSREAVPGALFVCKGAAFRREFLESALAAGAAAYVAGERHEGIPSPCFVVSDVRRAMARLACLFNQDPSCKLSLVGITGTKGKTTVAFYIDAVLREACTNPPALITGVYVDDGAVRLPSSNTTPEPIELQRCLARAVASGCTHAVMEVSSQGLKYHRTLGTHFAVGVFTNIGEDHISPVEHPTFEDYVASKLMLFAQCERAVVNLDMEHADRVLAAAVARGLTPLTYSLSDSEADVALHSAERAGEGAWRLEVVTPRGAFSFVLRALGSFNVSNALACVAVAEVLGIEHAAIARALASVKVPGRMERYDALGGSLVGIVDYAHNEMSLAAVLQCVREEFPGREVTVVFGSAGDRGVSRRSGLGRAAAAWADRIIITEDDPAHVPVAEIAEEIALPIKEAGRPYTVVEDRADAVREAVRGASLPAVVVLAGKGVEDTIRKPQGVVACPTDAELFLRAVAAERSQGR